MKVFLRVVGMVFCGCVMAWGLASCSSGTSEEQDMPVRSFSVGGEIVQIVHSPENGNLVVLAREVPRAAARQARPVCDDMRDLAVSAFDYADSTLISHTWFDDDIFTYDLGPGNVILTPDGRNLILPLDSCGNCRDFVAYDQECGLLGLYDFNGGLVRTYDYFPHDCGNLPTLAAGDFIVASGCLAEATIWNASTGDTVCTVRGDQCAYCCDKLAAVSPDGQVAVVMNGKVIETATGNFISHLFGARSVTVSHHQDITITPPGRYAVGPGRLTAQSPIQLLVWNCRSGAVECVLSDIHQDAFRIAASPDGEYIAASTSPDSVHVWQTGTWENVRSIAPYPMCEPLSPPENVTISGCLDLDICRITSIAFSADSRDIIVGNASGVIHVWPVVKPSSGVLEP